MVPKMPDSCLTAGYFVFYSLERGKETVMTKKCKLKEEKK